MSGGTSLSPSRTVVTSFGPRSTVPIDVDGVYEAGVWVLFVETKPTIDWVCTALSDGDLQIYDKERLHPLHVFHRVHGDSMVSDLCCGGPNLVASSGNDGRVCLFDVRQPALACQFALPAKEEALSIALGFEAALAAVGGSRARIHFHDLRKAGTFFGSYQDSHTEEVTRVRFQPGQDAASSTPLLLSGSEDGLACVFDTSQPSEEAALKSVLNVQTPLREVGFFGPSYDGVFCLTGSETINVWHHDSAQRIYDFGVDVRDKLSHIAAGLQVDYLVNCSWDTQYQRLSLLAGNHSGEAAVYHVEPGALSLSHLLKEGHKGDVRSWCMVSSESFVTAGEDARLCQWNRTGNRIESAGQANAEQSANMPSKRAGPVRRAKTQSRHNPY